MPDRRSDANTIHQEIGDRSHRATVGHSETDFLGRSSDMDRSSGKWVGLRVYETRLGFATRPMSLALPALLASTAITASVPASRQTASGCNKYIIYWELLIIIGKTFNICFHGHLLWFAIKHQHKTNKQTPSWRNETTMPCVDLPEIRIQPKYNSTQLNSTSIYGRRC